MSVVGELNDVERLFLNSGGRMHTTTGKLVDPTNLRPEDVEIVDIAHALSNLTRYSGHATRFYSVAEHSLLVAYIANEIAGPVAGLLGLAHDMHEAYGGYMISPLKRRAEMKPFRAWQSTAQQSIEQALFFGPGVLTFERELAVNEDRGRSAREIVAETDRRTHAGRG
jgi:hypothetical protein